MAPFESNTGGRGPPFSLRESLERVNKARRQLLQGEIEPWQLQQLQESAEDLADEQGITIFWFHSHAALFGSCNGIYWLDRSSELRERPRSK